MVVKPRVCRSCGVTNLEEPFYRRKRVRKCGVYYQYENICMFCHKEQKNEQQRRWVTENWDRKYAQNMAWRDRNRKKYNKSQRDWHNKRRRHALYDHEYRTGGGYGKVSRL